MCLCPSAYWTSMLYSDAFISSAIHTRPFRFLLRYDRTVNHFILTLHALSFRTWLLGYQVWHRRTYSLFHSRAHHSGRIQLWLCSHTSATLESTSHTTEHISNIGSDCGELQYQLGGQRFIIFHGHWWLLSFIHIMRLHLRFTNATLDQATGRKDD
jgi:hypothetical protein